MAAMTDTCLILLCLLGILSQGAFGQEINTDYLRRDETLQYDEIALRSNPVFAPVPDLRTLGLGVDEIRFLDGATNVSSRLDLGVGPSRYCLGPGWHGDETWAGGTTMCWADGLATQSVIYCHVPAGSRFLDLVCATGCAPQTNQVYLNGQLLGSFILPLDYAWQSCRLPLPGVVPRHVDYRLVEGGPVAVDGIAWIDSKGHVLATNTTVCTLDSLVSNATFSVDVSEGAGDFQVRLQKAPPAEARLQVTVNNSSSLIIALPAGTNAGWSLEKAALERQADRKTKEAGWGEDFNARGQFQAITWPGNQSPLIRSTGDSAELTMPAGEQQVWLTLPLPQALPIVEVPYLSLKLKVGPGAYYFIRPEGCDASNNPVALWNGSSVTEARRGTGDWETLTISLPKLAQMAGTGGSKVGKLILALVREGTNAASMEIDWVRIHHSFLPNPEDLKPFETDFANHLDDDGDGLTDKDDREDYQRQRFSGPLALGFYYGWFGSRYSTTGTWLGWAGEKVNFDLNSPGPPTSAGIVYDPETLDPQHPGKRNICSVYYPLKFWDYPDYEVPADGRCRYEIHGGVEEYDSLNPMHVSREIDLAQRYGVDGFALLAGGKTWVSPLQSQNELVLASAASRPTPFRVSVDYNNYYRLPSFYLTEEEPDELMALDLMFFSRGWGSYPCWLRAGSRPVVMATFLADLLPAEKWRRVGEVDPTSLSFGQAAATGAWRAGFANRLRFNFAVVAQPASDARYLSVAFDFIQLYDEKFNPLNTLDIGSSSARPHLLSGWGADEMQQDRTTFAWAEGTERTATLELEIPARAHFLEIRCHSFPPTNSITMQINEGAALTFSLSTPFRSHFFRLAESSSEDPPPRFLTNHPVALFLNHPTASAHYDGYVSYGSYLKSNRPLVSDPQPTILTVDCGYDDSKIREPSSIVDRENGAYYRRQWEAALDGEPDLVMIHTWNEWAEGTLIEPTVEFGFKYLQLTLTYSLMLHGRMIASRRPSEMDLTVLKYQLNPGGQAQIQFRAAGPGQVTFHDLPVSQFVSCQVQHDGQAYPAFALDVVNGTVSVQSPNAGGEFRFVFSTMALQIEQRGGFVNLSWPSSTIDFVVEQTDQLLPSAWQPAPGNPTVLSNLVTLPLPRSSGTRFYRLRQR
jgi:hypothetical protein